MSKKMPVGKGRSEMELGEQGFALETVEATMQI